MKSILPRPWYAFHIGGYRNNGVRKQQAKGSGAWRKAIWVIYVDLTEKQKGDLTHPISLAYFESASAVSSWWLLENQGMLDRCLGPGNRCGKYWCSDRGRLSYSVIRKQQWAFFRFITQCSFPFILSFYCIAWSNKWDWCFNLSVIIVSESRKSRTKIKALIKFQSNTVLYLCVTLKFQKTNTIISR